MIYNQLGATRLVGYDHAASPSRIIVLLKTLRHIIENLKKKIKKKGKPKERNHFSIKCNKHCFQKLHVDVPSRRKTVFQTSVP